MAAPSMAKMLHDFKNAQFIKEETDHSSQIISEVQVLAGDDLKGIMGRKAGRHLLDEYRRGVCGTMPAYEVADIHVRLWNALEAGDLSRANQIYGQVLPLLLFETTYGVAVYNEVLRRRGIIREAYYRQVGGKTLDKPARDELDSILTRIEDLITVDKDL